MRKFIKLLSKLFVATIIIFSLLSCDNTGAKIPPLEFEDEYLNNQVRLHALKQENTFITTDSIDLRITFRTDTEIVFPNNYNLRLFVWENETWVEKSEKPRIRLPEGNFVFSPLTSHQFPVIFVKPDYEDFNKEYYLRVYVSGEMMKDGEFKTVASFIDVELHP